MKAVMDLVALHQCGIAVGCKGEGLAEENPNTVREQPRTDAQGEGTKQGPHTWARWVQRQGSLPGGALTNENNSVVQKRRWWWFWGPAKAQRRKSATSEGNTGLSMGKTTPRNAQEGTYVRVKEPGP